MKRISDADAEALLALLDEALEPVNVAPSPAERAQFRAALADSRSTVARRRPAGQRVPMRARLAVVAVGVASILAVFAFTRPLPPPIRSVAHAVGLPVDSVELASARREMGDLEEALAGGDAREVTHSVEAVRAAVSRLDHDEHREIDERLARLLDNADRYLTEHAEPRDGAERTDGERRESPSSSFPADHGTNPATSAPAAGGEDEPANTDDGHQEPGPTATTTASTSDQDDLHDGGTTSEHDDADLGEPDGM